MRNLLLLDGWLNARAGRSNAALEDPVVDQLAGRLRQTLPVSDAVADSDRPGTAVRSSTTAVQAHGAAMLGPGDEAVSPPAAQPRTADLRALHVALEQTVPSPRRESNGWGHRRARHLMTSG